MFVRGTMIVVCAAAAPAFGQCSPRVIVTSYAALPSSAVPGAVPSARFLSSATPGNTFQRIVVSPGGDYWVLRAVTGSSSGQLIIRGSRGTRAGAALVARRTFTDILGGRTPDNLQANVDVNDAGTVAFSGDLSGSTADDGFLATWTPAGYTLVTREGQPVPTLPGIGFGTVNTNPFLLEDGRVLHMSSLLVGAADKSIIASHAGGTVGSVTAFTGTTVPAGQTGTPQVLQLFNNSRLASDDRGEHVLYDALLAGPAATQDVVVYNDRVILQRGSLIAGSGLSVAGASVAPSAVPLQCAAQGGTCLALVSLIDGTEAVLRIEQGQVTGTLARTDDPITPGSTDRYDDALNPLTFHAIAVSAAGTLITATIDSPDVVRNAVMVFNGRQVLLREGDEFDLNEDGVLNDNAFVAGFADGGLAMADTGEIYVSVAVGGATGNVTGTAILTLRAPTCGDLDFNNNGVVPEDQDVIDFFSVLSGASCPECDSLDFNGNCVVPEDQDVIDFFSVLAGGTCGA